MQKTQLEYLKAQFLRNSTFNYFQNEDIKFGQKEIQAFKNGLIDVTNHVKNAETEEDLISHIKEFREIYLSSFKALRDMNHPIKNKLSPYFFDAKINLVDKWYQQEKQNYEDKTKHQFFEKFRSFFVKDSVNFLENKEICDKAQSIIQKYKLTGIDLGDAKTSDTVLSYLNKIDTNFEDVCSKLGIKHEAIGLNRSLGLSYDQGAFYSSNTISTSVGMSSASTLLHEWVHALDNYIGMDMTNQPHAYASSNQDIAPIYHDDSMNQAFHTMKRLTSRIFNANMDVVQKNIDDQIHLGSCKFLSLAIGPKWYGLETADRQKLLTPEIKNAINNYMSFEYDTNDNIYQTILDKISSTGVINRNDLHQNLHENTQNIYDTVQPYYEKINKIQQSTASVYYVGAKLASWNTYVNRAFDSVTNKINKLIGRKPKAAGNCNDSDYFIQPIEMVARYFESQVYPMESRFYNMVALSAIYKMNKDSDFEEMKNKLISQALGQDVFVAKKEMVEKNESKGTLSRIFGIRQKMNLNTHQNEVNQDSCLTQVKSKNSL
jgi:hypothetical protein